MYVEHLETFQTEVDANLKPDFYDDIEPLDRPYFTASLLSRVQTRQDVKERLAQQKEIAKLRDELRAVRSTIARKERKKNQKKGKRKKRRGH